MEKKVIEGFPLSPQQKRLWTLAAAAGNQPYRAQCLVRLDGALDRKALARATARVVGRHEILRTVFAGVAEVSSALQVLSGPVPEVEAIDLSALAPERQEAWLAEQFEAGPEPFDLENGPVVCLKLVTLGEDRHALLLAVPALVGDLAAMEILAREIARAYAEIAADEEPPEAPLQYADLAEWQNGVFESDEAEVALAHWRGVDLSPRAWPRLPLESEPPPDADFAPRVETSTLPASTVEGLRALAARHGADLPLVLLAAWQILVTRLSGRAEVTLGVTHRGRDYQELEEAMGAFERYVPMAARIEARTRVSELLSSLAQDMETLAQRQECFDWDRLGAVEPQASAPPFLPVGFDAVEHPPRWTAAGLEFSLVRRYACSDRFTLKLVCVARGDGLDVEIHHDPLALSPPRARLLAGRFEALLASAVENPAAVAGELDVLDAQERRRLLVEFNSPRGEFRDTLFPRLFEEQAAARPGETALVFEDRELTYAELNRRANQLAHYLHGLGVGPEVAVALCLDRSYEVVVAMLGVLKAGGFYVPLDPSLPDARLAFMLEDSRSRVVVAAGRRAPGLEAPNVQVVDLESDAERIGRESEADPPGGPRGANLAYMIYTSGSTGRPKGVGVEHRQLVSYLHAVGERLALPPGARYAVVSTFAADLGNTCIFSALASGGSLDVVARERLSDAEALAEHFSARPCDGLKIVPSHLAALLSGADPAVILPRQLLVVGGEPTPRRLVETVRALAPDLRILNHYGPTETTVGVLTGALEGGAEMAGDALALTAPLANTRAYLLDRRLHPVPALSAGELYVGGANVTRGYVGRPARTAEVFLPDPLSGMPGGRLYKTGDLARQSEDGTLEVIGRADSQVKIRGFRVEPGEITEVLARHPALSAAAVVARRLGDDEELRLVAYAVAKGAAGVSTEELRGFLAGRLPDYMMPGAFVELEALPLNANGKLDAHRLPLPAVADRRQAGGAAPRNAVEEVLAGIWMDLLDVEQVGIDEDFFELGGHSLLITQVISRVRRAFRTELPFNVFFERPTIAGLAEVLGHGLDAEGSLKLPPIAPAPPLEAVPLSFSQQRLYFIDRLRPGRHEYNIPSALGLRGPFDVATLERAMSEVVRRHDVLRSNVETVAARPSLRIAPPWPVTVPEIDLRGLTEPRRAEELRRLASRESRRPFNLSRDRLIRAILLRRDEEDRVLLTTLHHIVSDAWSQRLLAAEIGRLYAAFRAGRPSPLPEPALQYSDYAYWQTNWLQGEVLERLESYWDGRLTDAPEGLNLPLDRPRQPGRTPVVARRALAFDAELSQRLRRLSRRHGTTLFMTLLAGLKALLRYATGQDDLVVGTNVANRIPIETESLIGCFINQLVLRTDLAGNPDFLEVMDRVKETALGAYAHQYMPFEQLVARYSSRRDLGRSPLFQVKLDVETPVPAEQVADVELRPLDIGYEILRYDLYFVLKDTPEGIAGSLFYDVGLFTESTIRRLAKLYESVLSSIVNEPETTIEELMKTLTEKNREIESGERRDLEQASLQKLLRFKRKPPQETTLEKGVTHASSAI